MRSFFRYLWASRNAPLGRGLVVMVINKRGNQRGTRGKFEATVGVLTTGPEGSCHFLWHIFTRKLMKNSRFGKDLVLGYFLFTVFSLINLIKIGLWGQKRVVAHSGKIHILMWFKIKEKIKEAECPNPYLIL